MTPTKTLVLVTQVAPKKHQHRRPLEKLVKRKCEHLYDMREEILAWKD